MLLPNATSSPLTIAFATDSVPMTGRTPWEASLGGSESAMVFMAQAMADRGHDVDVYTRCPAPGTYEGVEYHDVASLKSDCLPREWDVFVALRFIGCLQGEVRAGLKILWCQHVLSGLGARPMLDGWVRHLDRFTSDPPVGIGAPTRYRLIQDQDIFEIRAYFGAASTDPYLAVARFLANQETHLFGECVMWSPAIRHFGVLSLNNVNDNEDIVSFRTGPAPGEEVLRVTADGLLTVPLRTAYASLHATALIRTIKGADNSSAGLVIAAGSYETAYLGVANSTTASFHAPLPERVPDGATITSIGILYWRAAGGDTVTLRLFKTAVTDNTGTSVHTATGTGTAAAVTYLEDSVSPGEVLDYSTYAYGLVVTLGNGTAGNARFYALRITTPSPPSEPEHVRFIPALLPPEARARRFSRRAGQRGDGR